MWELDFSFLFFSFLCFCVYRVITLIQGSQLLTPTDDPIDTNAFACKIPENKLIKRSPLSMTVAAYDSQLSLQKVEYDRSVSH